MKKLIIILMILIFTKNSYAITRNGAEAVNWWLKQQGDFKHCITSQYDNEFKIMSWQTEFTPQPTDEELENIIDQYEAQYIKPKTLEERLSMLETKVDTLEKKP